jgi:hypothetical protein
VPTVVDDATLLAILSRRASPVVMAAADVGEVLCTGSWYYRLYRGLHDPTSPGALTGVASDLPVADQNDLYITLDDLPAQIIVPGPRLLVPVMGALRVRRRVNFLTAEALATALISDATIRVTAESPLLREACNDLDIHLMLATPFD